MFRITQPPGANLSSSCSAGPFKLSSTPTFRPILHPALSFSSSRPWLQHRLYIRVRVSFRCHSEIPFLPLFFTFREFVNSTGQDHTVQETDWVQIIALCPRLLRDRIFSDFSPCLLVHLQRWPNQLQRPGPQSLEKLPRAGPNVSTQLLAPSLPPLLRSTVSTPRTSHRHCQVRLRIRVKSSLKICILRTSARTEEQRSSPRGIRCCRPPIVVRA